MTKIITSSINTNGRELFELAKKISSIPDGEEADALEDALEHNIRGRLAVGDDQAFVSALELARSNTQEEAYYTLQFATEHYSTVSVRTFGSHDKPTNSYMFAVPVTILSANGMSSGKFDSQSAAFKSFVNSIRSDVLFGSESSVIINDYLYHPREVESFGPSMLSKMPDLLFSQGLGGRDIPDESLGRSGWPANNFSSREMEGHTHLDLRFLVGVVIGENDKLFYHDRYNLDDSIELDTIVRAPYLSDDELLTWQNNASELLTAAMTEHENSATFLVGRCYLLHEALREGITSFKLFSLRLQLNDVISGDQIMPKALSAILVPYGEVGLSNDGENGIPSQLRISIVSILDDVCRCGYIFELGELESFDDVVNRVV
jgi:hypothetical protein